MTNQIIEVPDISIVKWVSGTKQLLSLRDQKIKKDGSLHNFGAGSGVKYQGDLYVLDSGMIPIVTMTTTKVDPSFSVTKSGNIEVDWGDGTRENNMFSHIYTDGVEEHKIVFYGKSNILTYLYCESNQITSLDVSKNLELTELMSSDNPISSLDVSKNSKLEWLGVELNQLTSLDISKNLKLTHLIGGQNEITSLDTSKNLELTHLTWEIGQLASLDVSHNLKLKKLFCHDNPFIKEKSVLIDLANSLPQRESNNKGQMYLHNNVANTWIQAICDEKNWELLEA